MSDATNPTDMPALIAEARELDRAATKGPWTHEVYDSLEDAHDVGEFTWTEDGKTLGPNKPANVWAVVETIAGQLGSTGLPGSIEVGENNARLIARYRTLCLELADGCERQAKQAAEALEHRKRQALEIDRLEGEVARLQMLWEGAVSAGVGTLRDNHELRAELARVTGERDALQAEIKSLSLAITAERAADIAAFKRCSNSLKGMIDLQCERDKLRAERDALQAFKDYVHKRLDDAGVPVDPESSHKLEGCRIGGRLDIVLGAMSEREALAADRDRLDWLDKCADDWLGITCGKTKEAGAWKTHFSVCGKWGGKTASVTGDQASVRQAIDAARGEQAK